MSDQFIVEWQEYMDLWDKAQNSDIFDDAKVKVYNPTAIEDYITDEFGSSVEMEKIMQNSGSMSDHDYFSAVFNQARQEEANSKGKGKNTEQQVLQEGGSIDNPNPVNASSLGIDTKPIVTWADSDKIEELNKLKLDFYNLTSELAALGIKQGIEGWSEKVADLSTDLGDGIMKKVESLQKRIDSLSDSFSPGTADADGVGVKVSDYKKNLPTTQED